MPCDRATKQKQWDRSNQVSLVALMSEKSGNRHCHYASLKVDTEVLLLVRLAAAHASRKAGKQIKMQDWASDVLNEAAAKLTGEDPVKRKPPPPSKKPGPKRKPSD